VLVTNDDGPATAGLRALVRATAAVGWHQVVVAVPATEMSSTGTAINPAEAGPVEAWRSTRAWPGATAGYEVAGYPSMIVRLAAMGAFGAPPDLVLAGVNAGVNIGRSLIHSSTIGAALAAAVYGLPAVAISAALGADWAALHPVLVRLLGALPPAWPDGVVLSVNLPRCPAADPARIVWCRPADLTAASALSRTSTDDGHLTLSLSYQQHRLAPPDTDAGVLAAGGVALTCLTLPYTDPVDPQWQQELTWRLRPGSQAAAGSA
jgi:5'-nucleotidase